MTLRALFSIAAVGVALAAPACVGAQWELQESGVKESLRGISAVSEKIAWASGTHGTVLLTDDSGKTWRKCAQPEGPEGRDFAALDFRAVVAFDRKTALAMSAGSGALSKLYKTVDGCASWQLLAANQDKEGFWDALVASDPDHLMMLGDPVGGKFVVRTSTDGGRTWTKEEVEGTAEGEGVFAASNTSLLVAADVGFFATGGKSGPRLYSRSGKRWIALAMPAFASGESSGIFSIATQGKGADAKHLVAVGGDYQKPDAATGNVAWSDDGGQSWHAGAGLRGYRSAVAYEAKSKLWIAVGPGGTDLSRDGGKTWSAAKPGPSEPAGIDAQWNAVSLPFVVGSKGRIGKWRGR